MIPCYYLNQQRLGTGLAPDRRKLENCFVCQEQDLLLQDRRFRRHRRRRRRRRRVATFGQVDQLNRHFNLPLGGRRDQLEEKATAISSLNTNLFMEFAAIVV